jgi:hypothetical protein
MKTDEKLQMNRCLDVFTTDSKPDWNQSKLSWCSWSKFKHSLSSNNQKQIKGLKIQQSISVRKKEDQSWSNLGILKELGIGMW